MIPFRKGRPYLNLTDLLDQSTSGYEFFYSLPPDVQDEIIKQDINTFEEMQEYADRMRKYHELK